MTAINLYDQLLHLMRSVRRSIDTMEDGHPLKRWFAIELEMCAPEPRDNTRMEDVSARMRAVRQLEHMVHGCLVNDPEPFESRFNPEESVYTRMARIPASLLQTVKQTNFSIEPSLLLERAEQVDLFDLVSPTAKVVSYLRSRDGSLAFADRLSCPDEARTILRDLGIIDPEIQDRLAGLFRSRYHCINAVITHHNVLQVLEIAAGISPRGLHWSREHPGTVFVESDLPGLMREKAKSIRDSILDDPVTSRGVLHCCGLDALDLAGLRRALEYTDRAAPTVIVTEGLLLYFSAEEMRQFLDNMRTVLTERPQTIWVVDMVSRQNLAELSDSDLSVARAIRSVFASTRREVIAANPFQNDTEIRRALHANRLRVVSTLSLADCPHNPAHFDSMEDARSICGSRKIWSIAIAK